MTEAFSRYARWEREPRYYELRLQQDLWGDWVLMRVWGQQGSSRGQIRNELCSSGEEGLVRYARAEKIRAQRGYQRVRTG